MESRPRYTVFKRGKDKVYTYRYLDYKNKWRSVKTEFTKKESAKEEAKFMAMQQHKIRIFMMPEPTAQDGVNSDSLQIHLDNYLQYGEAHGGKFRKPWDSEHIRKLKAQITWWLAKTGWGNYAEINVRKAERILQKKSLETRLIQGKKVKITGKTVNHYKTALVSFVNYIRKEFQINGDDPLAGLSGWDTSVTYKTRDLTLDELKSLLKVAPVERRLIYLTAVITGLRREELSNLTGENYDRNKACFALKSGENKERMENVRIFLPPGLNEDLKSYVKKRGRYPKLFKFNFERAAELFDLDCKTAGVKKETKEGKVVFKSLRDTHVNLVIDLGADVKTGMSLSRHKTAAIYLGNYAQRKDGKLQEMTKKLENSIIKGLSDE